MQTLMADRLCIPPQLYSFHRLYNPQIGHWCIIIHSRNSRATVTQRIVLIRANAVCKMYSITMHLCVLFFRDDIYNVVSHPLIHIKVTLFLSNLLYLKSRAIHVFLKATRMFIFINFRNVIKKKKKAEFQSIYLTHDKYYPESRNEQLLRSTFLRKKEILCNQTTNHFLFACKKFQNQKTKYKLNNFLSDIPRLQGYFKGSSNQ